MSPTKLVENSEWSTFAPAFMQMVSAGPGTAPAQHMATHADKLLPFSQATTVLDMGCGPGQVTEAVLAQHGARLPAEARVVGADNNTQMLQGYAARKEKEISQGKEHWKRAETVQTDVHDCAAFADGSASHILAGFLVFLVPEPEKALQAMKRVLKPGGVLALSAWQESEWMDFMYYPKKVRPDLVMPVPPADWTMPESVRTKLEQAGFKYIEVIQTEGYMPFEDYAEICRFMLTKMPLAARAVTQMTDEEVLRTHELMVKDIKARHPTVPAKMVGKATIAYCRK
ncbi:Methyltransferase type 11 domain-containing protein [Madurella fahalii]|uniref:Methyltransferase type 11 domain-containing protein n=1 Tax=Madurella fahalii TaxID=1157608 RepID=A0ABQ0GNG7_9PEZI